MCVFFLGYASSSSGGAGLYNSNNYDGGDQYSSKYPYSNQYSGYASTGGGVGVGAGAFPFVPFPAIPSPFQFNNAFQQYYNSLNAFNAKYGVELIIKLLPFKFNCMFTNCNRMFLAHLGWCC